MSAYVMESGGYNVGRGLGNGPGDGLVDGLRRFVFRLFAAMAIVLVVLLGLALFVPLVLIWVIYVTVRSVAAGIFGRAHRVNGPGAAYPPIPDADGEGRENVRVRRADAE